MSTNVTKFTITLDDKHREAALREIEAFAAAAEGKTLGDYSSAGFLYHMLDALGAFESDKMNIHVQSGVRGLGDGVVSSLPRR